MMEDRRKIKQDTKNCAYLEEKKGVIEFCEGEDKEKGLGEIKRYQKISRVFNRKSYNDSEKGDIILQKY